MSYLVYYHYENLSLIESATALFKMLEIDAIYEDKFEYYGGKLGHLVNEKLFFIAQAYNIAKASSKNKDLLVLEEDAFNNLTFAKREIECNPSLFNLVQNELGKCKLKYSQDTKVIYLADLLSSDAMLEKIKQNQKADFNSFSISIFHSHYLKNNSIVKIYKELGLKIALEEYCEFYKNQSFNPNLAYKYSAKSFEKALDSGSDFILSLSSAIFDMFDKERKYLTKAANRDLGKMPIIFLPQLLLLSIGIKDENALNFRYHKFGFDFI